MTRKLHNTLMAIIASSSLLAVGLIAGTPVAPSPHGTVANASVDPLDEAPPMPDSASSANEASSTLPTSSTRGARSSGQSVSMPFFSFVPRG